jgi:polyisoprenyl-teichoic acid--peptidoglycan teichoic acid transferase
VSLIPRTRGGSLWRFVLAAVLVIGCVAAATAVAGLLQFKQLAIDISGQPALPGARVTLPNPGQPQTILIIGSDHRAGEPFRAANTDTMLLVRLNGSSQTINVLSIPRDLEVQIPGFGTAKLNAAYSDGGPNLLIKTIQQNVFSGLRVNHIVDINFGGFSALVNAIGCVYTDVDHRYYNNTLYTNYSSIDVQAGYQKLCGTQALQFVRFRHTDTDLVREARQQDFIRWAKDQYGSANIINNRDKLLKIFGKHTQTDHNLHTLDGIENLFNLVAFSAGHTIKQIKFPAILQPCTQTACFVTAESSAEQGVYRAFMRPTVAVAKKAKPDLGAHVHKRGHVSTAGLTMDVADGKAQAGALSRVGMPVYYPRWIVSNASSEYCSSLAGTCENPPNPPSEFANAYPRGYTIHDQQGKTHAAYRITIALNPLLGEYYGVQGTTWQNPPLLASPSGTRNVGGKHLLLYAQGGKITNVAWHTRHGVYWISNTLTTDIPNGEMVSMAALLARG